MTTPALTEINLEAAEQVYSVANTPLFVARKLRELNVTQQIADNYADRDVLKELRKVLRVSPDTFADSVRPYVYLVSLSKKHDLTALKAAASLESEHHKWYPAIVSWLVEKSSPTSLLTLDLSNQVQVVRPQMVASKPKLILLGE